MKKILFVHTEYTETGGEDIAVKNEINFLKNHYEVETLIFNNSLKISIKDLFWFVLNNNKESVKELKIKLFNFDPDYIYVHNLWFKGSLEILKYINKNQFKVILKMHNFRYFCTKSYLSNRHLQNNNMCLACGMQKKTIGIFNKYFTDSLAKSVLVTYFGHKYFKILKNGNFKILTLTNHHKSFLIELGFEESRLYVLPNPSPKLEKILDTGNSQTKQIVYAGRISKEKGIIELLQTWNKLETKEHKLIIIGDGPACNEVKGIIENIESIVLMGYRENQDVIKIISESKAVVTTTKLYEGQPTLLSESSALGVPSIFPNSGGIAEFFYSDYEYIFKQFDYEDLLAKLQQIIDINDLREVGKKNKNYILEFLDENKLLTRFEKILGASNEK